MLFVEYYCLNTAVYRLFMRLLTGSYHSGSKVLVKLTDY